MTPLPPAGRWALGADARVQAERLLQLAQRQGLRTGWLGRDARFLSNLSILENLRLLYQWRDETETGFRTALQGALEQLQFGQPDWLQQRPAQLRDAQLLRAGLLRVFLTRPDVLVLQASSLPQMGMALTDQLVATFAESRLLLLAEPGPDWPAWPPSGSASAVEGNPA